jgi:hypothetical protein
MTLGLKHVLGLLILVGGLGSFSVAGTFALFSAGNTNGLAFATGTLVFNNTVDSGTDCFSDVGADNANQSCDALVTDSTLNGPGDSIVASVKIANTGSLDGADLSVYMPGGCSHQTVSGATSGGGDPCGAVELYIQETNSSGTPLSSCLFPADASNPCTFADSLGTFAAAYTSSSVPLDLGAGPASGATRYFHIGLKLPAGASSTLQGEEADFGLTWHLST